MKKEINGETFTYANYTRSRSKIEINKNNDDELFMRLEKNLIQIQTKRKNQPRNDRTVEIYINQNNNSSNLPFTSVHS